jgi:hypothetical protein
MTPESANARLYVTTSDMAREMKTLLGFTTLQATFEFIIKEKYESAAVTQLREMKENRLRLLREAAGK